jgi:hypothetical protein
VHAIKKDGNVEDDKWEKRIEGTTIYYSIHIYIFYLKFFLLFIFYLINTRHLLNLSYYLEIIAARNNLYKKQNDKI